jgi:hypothetical protein
MVAQEARSLGAKTTVVIQNQHINNITYQLSGSGVGGCGGQNQPLAPGGTDPDSCYCSWGTLNYKFKAYDPVSPLLPRWDRSCDNGDTHADDFA